MRAKGNILTRSDLPPEIWAPSADRPGRVAVPRRPDKWQEVERHHIRVSLELCGGNRQKAVEGRWGSASARCIARSRNTTCRVPVGRLGPAMLDAGDGCP